jgi:hypothetical protein
VEDGLEVALLAGAGHLLDELRELHGSGEALVELEELVLEAFDLAGDHLEVGGAGSAGVELAGAGGGFGLELRLPGAGGAESEEEEQRDDPDHEGAEGPVCSGTPGGLCLEGSHGVVRLMRRR